MRARRLRSLLTAAGIVLGVGMILGVLLLTATIHRTFTDLFDSVYGRTDLVVSGVESTDSLPHSTLATVARDAGRRRGAGQRLRASSRSSIDAGEAVERRERRS